MIELSDAIATAGEGISGLFDTAVEQAAYVHYVKGELTITLDGTFTFDELASLVAAINA